ncbi:MAG: AAA family ATPase [Anaerolineae bacterium]|nr:AAA family ATPase [Anaerolineae bacterium]
MTDQPDQVVAAISQQQADFVARLKEVIAVANTPDELGIPAGIVSDIIFKILFNEGEATLKRLSDVIKVHGRVIDVLVEQMQYEHLVEVAKAGSANRATYAFSLTDEGMKRARDAMERNLYIGPAPVASDKYNEAVLLQSQNKIHVTPPEVKAALSHLILPDNFHRSIGPAINGGTSLFLYGPPGNGKTTVAEAIAKIITGTTPVFMPYAVTVAGYIVTIFDPLIHKHADVDPNSVQSTFGRVDPRWAIVDRPTVMVGGELTMDALELRFEELAKYYEAPLQMKANMGMFLIDDFGRQQISPAQLLNRWIVPLESHIDFLRLRTGQAMQIPFKQLIVFSTNLDPDDLVDAAFMRRIQMKVGVRSPSESMFRKIFLAMAQSMGIPPDRETYAYLLKKWYEEPDRPMQAVHPRDLLRIVKALCEYDNTPVRMTPELMREACVNYFVSQEGEAMRR